MGILKAVFACKDYDPTELGEKIHGAFIRNFGTDIFKKDMDECISIANKILITLGGN